jgi:hypothetical protein
MITTNRAANRDTEDYVNASRSVLKSHYKTEATKPPHKATNLLDSFAHGKWGLWIKHYLKSRFGPRHKFLTYQGTGVNGIYEMDANAHNQVKVAIVSDWGTDTNESMSIGLAVDDHKAEYTIHLGDTYFVGAPPEIDNNFKPGDSYWPYGSKGSFALPGNHEMYSNGNPYYDKLLTWMGLKCPTRQVQLASYVCLQNDHWRVIGLDTGYRSVSFPFIEYFFSKADLRDEIITWLKDDLNLKNDNRGLIFLSHHQYVSSFSPNFPRAARQLRKVIGYNRKVLWFWGHEHRLAFYGKSDKKDGIPAYGRCIGHGGMPIEPINKLNIKRATKDNLVLYDNRVRMTTADHKKFGHNGYAMLKFENEKLEIEYYDEINLLVTEKWKYDKLKGEMIGEDIVIHDHKLSLNKEPIMAIQ